MQEVQKARVILLDQDQRVLLFRIDVPLSRDPEIRDVAIRWIGPGGGIEPGESAAAAAHRELLEETGMSGFTLSEQLDTIAQEVTLPDGSSLRVVHHIFAATINAQEIDFTGMDQEELSIVTGFRWWSMEELHAEQPDVRPPGFVELVRSFLEDALH